jgi:enoyl-CoA hydratase/carnithine racemase
MGPQRGNLVLAHPDDGVAIVTLNRPESMNALSRPLNEMCSAFADSSWAMMELFDNACSRTGPD